MSKLHVAVVVLSGSLLWPMAASAGRWNQSRGNNRVAHWVDSLQWPDAEVREVSARALGAVGDPGAVRPLIQALDDESGHVRVAAAWALGELGANRATRHLTRVSSTDPHSPARAAALRALGKIAAPDRETFDALRSGLGDRDAFVRATAAEGFAYVGGQRAVPDLERLLDDPAWSVRVAAAIGIGQVEAPGSAGPLARVLATDDHEYVRAAAAYSLGRVGGNEAVAALKNAVDTDPSSRVHLQALRALVELRVPIERELGTEPTYQSEAQPQAPQVHGARRSIDL